MKVSQKGIDLIKKFEGFSATEYTCSAGKHTIGYGHVLKEGEQYEIITNAQAEELLRQDIETAEYTVNKAVLPNLTQNRFDALVSLVYNWGGGNFLRSNGLRALNHEDYEGAIEEFSEVNKVNGKVSAGLVSRRRAEAELWNATA